MNTFRKRMVHPVYFWYQQSKLCHCVTYYEISASMTWALNHLSFTQPSEPGGGKSFCWLIKMPALPPPPAPPNPRRGRGWREQSQQRAVNIPKSDSELKTATKTQAQRGKGKNKKMQQKRIPMNTGEPNDCTLATDLPSELLLGSLPPLKESLLCGHGFFLRGLPLRFGAENKWRTIERHFHLCGFSH